ncbi:hypothetical protein V2I01_16715 [Micromonospora sp. BRA006-A]|nr:hypothetical protein [Micromonospora sp. BRA006-A]
MLRPKADGRQAHFYTVVSRDTIDTEYAAHRQRFLAEQGTRTPSWTPTTCSGRRCPQSTERPVGRPFRAAHRHHQVR